MRAPATPANMPVASAAREARSTASPLFAECAAKRPGGSVEPSRTAAMGGTRVALRAGRTLASTVTEVPTSIDTVTVRVAITVLASGRSTPSALIRAIMPLAMPMPATSPAADAARPMTRPSRTTERLTCLREAPSVRSVANSRVRCATVIDSVLKMTNAPTSSAMPPKPSRTRRMVFMPSLMFSALSLAATLESLTSRSLPTSGLIAFTSCADEVPSFAATEIAS